MRMATKSDDIEIELFGDKILLLCSRAVFDLHTTALTCFLANRKQVFCTAGFIKGKKKY